MDNWVATEGCRATQIQKIPKSLAHLCLEICPSYLSQVNLRIWGPTSQEMLIVMEEERNLAHAPGKELFISAHMSILCYTVCFSEVQENNLSSIQSLKKLPGSNSLTIDIHST